MKRSIFVLLFICLIPSQVFSNPTPPQTFVTAPTWTVDHMMTPPPNMTFIRNFKYTYTPAGGAQITVDAVEINGEYLYLSNHSGNIHTIPVVKLGGYAGVSLTILAQGPIGASPTKKNVIAQLPNTYIPGTHLLSIQTYALLGMGDSTFFTIQPTNVFPTDSVILFSGAVNAIPSGWQVCDGTNSKPNLKDKFVVGAGNTYTVGATGGRKTIANHTLTTAQIPSHNHSYSQKTIAIQNGRHQGGGNAFSSQSTRSLSTGSKGGGQGHNHGDNRPPFHALTYICNN